MKTLRGLCVGAGYFASFHFDAWRRIPGVEIVGVCDRDLERAKLAAESMSGAAAFTDLPEAIAETRPDFVDVITPPAGRLAVVSACVEAGAPMICQKPLAPTYAESQAIVRVAGDAGVRLMVHENFRFQPWHREIKRLIEAGAIGDLHTLTFRTRMGDGWQDDAYLDRQPYFRQMPRLLVHETGVHFLDTFRYLAGEIDSVFAVLRKMNPAIAGEDAALLNLRFASGAVGVWDASRYNESTSDNPRRTFGEFSVEGTAGTIHLNHEGHLCLQPLGEPPKPHPYEWRDDGFAGDCVHATQQHFVDRLRSGEPFETDGADYLESVRLVEAAYQSAALGAPVSPAAAVAGDRGRRVVDLSRTIDNAMPGVAVRPAKQLRPDGWNATTLELYSHSGSHMDAPKHFLEAGNTIDQQDLAICVGPARVVDLTPVEPGELISTARFFERCPEVRRGDRLLLRTDWHHRFLEEAYRNALPRISTALARWLVDKQVALVGVEPPSVADVNNLPELTEVHRILLGGGVTIVEGLVGLDRLESPVVEFIALPLKIAGGDGSPVRAIALENTR